MGVLLGCLCADGKSAAELTDVLSRSGVRINQRPVHTLNDQLETELAPFEIIVLGQGDQEAAQSLIDNVIIAGSWLARHKAKRCLLHYPSHDHAVFTSQLVQTGNVLIELIAQTEPRLRVYCPAGQSDLTSDATTNNASAAATTTRLDSLVNALSNQLNRQPDVIERLTIEQGPLAILQSMDDLLTAEVHHVIMDAQDSNELMNIIRATEQLPLLVGGSGLGLHLPALFRIRGWLGTGDQIVPIE